MLPDIRSLITLVESLLVENTLSKGSQFVLNNKKLVTELADVVRDDVNTSPHNFPADFVQNVKGSVAKGVKKFNDQQIAEWIMTQLDRIEEQGYEGVRYQREGKDNKWIVERYIAGSHNWEDITGTLNLNLGKFYFLKNRNMLEPAHSNLGSFKSVRDLGNYLVFHYQEALKDYNERMKLAAMKRAIRAFVIVDNDDYKIYVTLNRAANVLYGQGSNWCTANSGYGGHFQSYSTRAMLFQLYPYAPDDVSITKATNNGEREFVGKERFQFDAGNAQNPDFKNIADSQANAEYIREKFPYLYTDLVTGLKEKKPELEAYMKTASEDPALQTDDTKIKTYNIDDEIEKLKNFIRAGYMTTTVRPAVSEEEPEALPDNSTPPAEPTA